MALKEYAGNAPATRLQNTLASGATTDFTVITGGGTGYPSGATAPFVIVIDRGTASEEKILVASRSGDTFTGLTRGYDGTSDQAHSAQAVVEHVWDAVSATEANAHANNTTDDVHPQYATAAEVATALSSYSNTTAMNAAIDAAVIHQVGHTFVIAGDVVVPSGNVDYMVPFFVPVAAGTTVKLIAARHRLNAGTSATVKLQKNGVDITGFTGISVTTTSATTDPADVTLADNDLIALIVTAVSGSPRNLTFTLYLEIS